MSIANEQQFAMDQLVEANDGSKKKLRISYSRKFLLSFSDKDVCKKMPDLPSEFHESLLIDSDDPSPERFRHSGDFSSHGLRRNDYSSSPPTRGEFGSNPRGIHGRWEGRSGGWNDKDSDSQSDHSESGRRSGMPSRRPWQAPEHDGLLGKGSFPKPTGFGAGTSGPRPQSNEPYQLRKSNEPYHPPRPYKAPPFTRRDTRDSFNDETFGSSDSTIEDRAEEERKRRASFELLRKEHQKSFQERQKLNPELRKNDFDFAELVAESKDEKDRPSRSDEVNNTPTIPGSNNPSFPSQSNAPRPLVPPGFASTILERKQEEKPQTETSQHERSPLNSKGIISMVNGMSITKDETPSGIKLPSSEMLVEGEAVRREQADNISSFLGISKVTVNKDKSFEKLPSMSTATVTLDQKKSLEKSDEPSILDKLLNTAINLDTIDPPKITQKNIEKVEETRSSPTVKSSKFAHLFLEEENNKPVEDLLSSKPPPPRGGGGLLSLLQVADNKSQTFDDDNTKAAAMDFPFQGHTAKTNTDQLLSNTSSTPSKKPVLTCEDLEQSILSEVSETYHPPPHQPPLDQQDSGVFSKTKEQKQSVDNQASQHLLSLLQRSADPTKSQDITETRPPALPSSGEVADPGKKSLTLENLFGSAFMNELQSIGEPVSGKAMVSDAPPPGVPLRSERSIGELNQRNGLLGFPEDGNLLAAFGGSHHNHQEPEVAFNISDKLAALNSGPMGGGGGVQDGGQFHRHHHHHHQQYANNGSGGHPVFNPFDPRHAHVKPPQLDFMTQQQDPSHRFPPNMIHHQHHHRPPPPPPFHHTTATNNGVPEFDHRLPPPHIMQQQKMHLPADNLLQQHHHLMQQGFPGGGHGGPPPPHLNQMPGPIPELNPSQGFPFAHRLSNYAMAPPPIPGISGTQVTSFDPASLQTLLGIHQNRMDPQIPTAAMGQAGGPNRQGSIGHELDLGFGYR